MASSKRKPKKTSLASGRPPNARKAKASLTAQATRTLIRSHHRLNKDLHKVKSAGDDEQAAQIQEKIESLGGLGSYQQASILGQAKDRGGDSSVVLMKWLQPLQPQSVNADLGLRMLEVGALSTKNACSTSGLMDVVRVDLHSQSEGIMQQDFMERPLPKDDAEKFDIISLSLVLNYVPDASGRGDMLKWACKFLRRPQTEHNAAISAILPALFIVLPAPCVVNSRYLDEDRMTLIMEGLGFAQLQRKQTSKLIYYLWQYRGGVAKVNVPKREVNAGAGRNNFCIVLGPT